MSPLLLLVLLAIHVNAEEGPAFYHSFNGHRYALLYDTEKVKFAEARSECQKWDSDLASIHSQEEADFIKGVEKNNQSWLEDTWIGLVQTNTLTSSDLTWVDGTKFDYKNWAPKEPKFLGNGLYCGQVRNQNDDENFGKWKIVKCDDEAYAYICKKPDGKSGSSSSGSYKSADLNDSGSESETVPASDGSDGDAANDPDGTTTDDANGADSEGVTGPPGDESSNPSTNDDPNNPSDPSANNDPSGAGNPSNPQNPDDPGNTQNPGDQGNTQNPGDPGNTQNPNDPNKPTNSDKTGGSDQGGQYRPISDLDSIVRSRGCYPVA